MNNILSGILIIIIFWSNISCKEEVENPVEETEIVPADFSERTYKIYIPESINMSTSNSRATTMIFSSFAMARKPKYNAEAKPINKSAR